MTEADLDRLLGRGALRLRMNALLCWTCAGLGSALGLAALVVAVSRLDPGWSQYALPALQGLPVLVLIAAIVGFARTQPVPGQVALLLDRRADLAEHLTTWEDLRRRPELQDAVAKAFVLAQRQATLRQAKGVHPRRHMPLRLPAWSRLLLLGGLGLGCALLMPQRETSRLAEATTADGGSAGSAGGDSTQTFAPQADAPTMKIEILSPTEKMEIVLALANPEGSEQDLKSAYEQIEKKRGPLPVHQMTDEVRGWREDLRKQLGLTKDEAPQDPVGSKVHEAVDVGQAEREAVRRFVEAIPPTARVEDLLGVQEKQFPDVQSALERYYRSAVSSPN